MSVYLNMNNYSSMSLMKSGNFLFGSIRSPPERTHFMTANRLFTIKILSFPRMLENIHCPRCTLGHLNTQNPVAVAIWFSFPKACDAVPVSYTLCLFEILSSCSRYASAGSVRNTLCLLQIRCVSLCLLSLR